MEKTLANLYQILGDYFTGIYKRRLLSIIITVVYFTIIVVCSYLNIEVSKETLNLVFSSIIQALLSLVALLGVAAFFKLEAIKSEEDKILELATYTNPPFYYPWLSSKLEGKLIGSGEQLMTAFESILAEGEPEEATLRFLKGRLEEVFSNKKHVVTYILNFTIYNFFTVVLSLILLIITPFLVSHNLGVVSLLIIFYLTCDCLFLVVKGIADAVYH